MKTTLIILLISVTTAFIPVGFKKFVNLKLSASDAIAAYDDEYVGKSGKFQPFDMDFAEAISKPLPNWYKEDIQKREALKKEIEQNRERILKEFKEKYDISEAVKSENIKKKMEEKQKRNRARQQKKALSWGLSTKSSTDLDEYDTIEDSKNLTTKEIWERFVEKEEEQTGFYFPGIFEVFPELKLKWPKWFKRKDGSAVECETDDDCPFPQACCAHPIIPGQKFCCTGWSQRIMVPAYVGQEIFIDSNNADKVKSDEKSRGPLD